MQNQNIAQNRIRNKQLFLWSMLLTTIVPFIIGIALIPVSISNEALVLGLLVLLVTPLGAHQVTTMYFYFDKLSLPIIQKNWQVYLLNPLIIMCGCFILMYFGGKQLAPYLAAILSAWTIYHYQKQNVGIFSLISPLINRAYMTPIEKRLIICSGVSGMLAFGSPTGTPLFEDTLFETFGPYAYQLSKLMLGIILAIFITLLWKSWRDNHHTHFKLFILRWGMLLLFLSFYTPLYLIENKLLAFGMFASAHGLQYLFIMLFVASDGNLISSSKLSKRHIFSVVISVCFLILMTVILWKLWTMTQVAGNRFEGQPLGYALLGLAVSFSFVHYYLDGKLWKMSNPAIKQFMQQKLDFIFK